MQGLATTEIAATLHIATDTVQDHLKAAFDKVGVHSRCELVALIFAQQYEPAIKAGGRLNADGGFAEDVSAAIHGDAKSHPW